MTLLDSVLTFDASLVADWLIEKNPDNITLLLLLMYKTAKQHYT